MSEENIEAVRRVYEGVNTRLEVPRELFDPGYEFDNTELWPDIVEVLGFDAAQETMREYWETFETYRVELEEVIYADDGRVLNVVRDGGRMSGSDAEVLEPLLPPLDLSRRKGRPPLDPHRPGPSPRGRRAVGVAPRLTLER